MNCRDYSELISAQMDGAIRPAERALLVHHLNECESCLNAQNELQTQAEFLRSLRAGKLSEKQAQEMQAATMWALQIEVRKQIQQVRLRADRQANWRIKFFSQSFAAVVSSLLFLMLVTAVLRPAQRALNIAQDVAQIVIRPDTDEEIAELKDLLLPLPVSPRPILDPRGTLIGFSKEVDDEEFAVIAWVGVDGKASIKQVIEAPNDPAVIGKLSTALNQQANFKPAFRHGKYTPSDAILMFSRITIIG